jgi:hypothetical protein
MRETLIVIGLFVLAMALRSSRINVCRKLGAATFLLCSYSLFFFISGSILIGALGASLWFFLPWFDLLTRARHLRHPINNRLTHRELPNPSFFPNAVEAAAGMEEAQFEYISDCGWQWAGMRQHFRLFWNPEERSVASVCLCEQEDVAFAFISITSTDTAGKRWRTTNFPFAPTLRCTPDLKWNHVPCEKSCFHQILKDHRNFLKRERISADKLMVPDPETLEDRIENEMNAHIEHNLNSGIIEFTEDGKHFKYSARGLFFLWGQAIKDMVRLC